MNQDAGIAVCGGVGLLGLIFWMWLFLTQVRPWIARGLGKWLGVTIREGGMYRNKSAWGVVEPHRPGAAFLVGLADIALLLLMSLGPFAGLMGVLLVLSSGEFPLK